MGRQSIRPKKRFAIFARDDFTCQYCGAKAPQVVLEIDHITPVCKGGTNDESNLITACRECNNGKSSVEVRNKANGITSLRMFQKNVLSAITEATEPRLLDERIFSKCVAMINDFGYEKVLEAVSAYTTTNSCKIDDFLISSIEEVAYILARGAYGE